MNKLSGIDTRPRPDAPNRVQTVEKKEDGSLDVVLKTGEAFTLPVDCVEIQVWVVWTMLANAGDV